MMNFNQKAHLYEASASSQKDLIKWGLSDIAPYIQNKTVLELGSGTGLLSQKLLPLSPQKLYCTDISPNMLSIGKASYPKANWQYLNAWNLHPFPSGHVDTIISSSLLQWCYTPSLVLRNWLHHLKPKGIIVAAFFIDNTLHELRSLSPLISPLPWLSKNQWNAILRQTKAQVIHSKSCIKTFYFPSTLCILRQLHQTGAITRRQLSAHALKKVINAYEQRFTTPQGIPCSWHYYTFILKKHA